MSQDALVASVLAGAASGSRSFTGIGVLALTADSRGSAADRILARPAVRYGVAALAAFELVADKLPQTPSRLEVPGLVGRVVGAAASGAVLAQRSSAVTAEPGDPSSDPTEREPTSVTRTLACAGVAVLAAGATAFGGIRARAWVRHRVHYDLIPALVEDLGAIGLAAAATR